MGIKTEVAKITQFDRVAVSFEQRFDLPNGYEYIKPFLSISSDRKESETLDQCIDRVIKTTSDGFKKLTSKAKAKA